MSACWNATIQIDTPMRLDLPIPDGLRYGQALFVFLCWLAESRRHKSINCYVAYPMDGDHPAGGRTDFAMADPFNLPDDQFERLWAEWLDEKFPDLSSDL